MRIAQVSPLFESVPPKLYGGTERVVAFLTDELVQLGHDVTLFATADSRTLAKLVSEERIFKSELFGAAPVRKRRGPGRPRKAGRRGKPAGARARRRGTPQAEKYFQKLGKSFTLEDVRKLAGRRAGISIAQWSRAKRVRKVGNGYQKTAA